MRWIILASILLVPAVAAQSVLPMGAVGVEAVQAPPAVGPYQSSHLQVQGIYSCDGSEYGEPLHVSVEARAEPRNGDPVQMDQVPVQLVDVGACTGRPGETVSFDIEVAWTMGNFTQRDVLDIRLILESTMGEGVTYRGYDEIEASTSVPMLPYEPVIEPVEEATPDSKDKKAPGPALPMLGLGLLALARRR